jgi:hypothetical protein
MNVAENELHKIRIAHGSHISNYDISNYLIQQRYIELDETVDSKGNI